MTTDKDFTLQKTLTLQKSGQSAARQKMRKLVDSDANRVTKVFSTLFKE